VTLASILSHKVQNRITLKAKKKQENKTANEIRISLLFLAHFHVLRYSFIWF